MACTKPAKPFLSDMNMEAVFGGTFIDVLKPILERLANCRMGKHEWQESIEGEFQPDGAYLFRKVYTCKVCGTADYGAWDIRRD